MVNIMTKAVFIEIMFHGKGLFTVGNNNLELYVNRRRH